MNTYKHFYVENSYVGCRTSKQHMIEMLNFVSKLLIDDFPFATYFQIAEDRSELSKREQQPIHTKKNKNQITKQWSCDSASEYH